MSVWFCIPSKRPAAECAATLQKWADQGYKIALFCDSLAEAQDKPCNLLLTGKYVGYPATVNRLMKAVLLADSTCNWVVTGGDDIEPDPNKTAEEIAAECREHFRVQVPGVEPPLYNCTFGVMQPTGDRWGEHETTRNHDFRPHENNGKFCGYCGNGPDAPIHLMGAYIDRVAGSAWIGREFCRRAYGGDGPFWPGYFHMFDDQELQTVATMLGVFWQRRDLTHLHHHWGRPKAGEVLGDRVRMPQFLEYANSIDNWTKSKSLFLARRDAGFPGHEVID